MYATIYHGAPYGVGGERGDDVRTLREADKLARKTLHAGQRMDACYVRSYDGAVVDWPWPRARWEHDAAEPGRVRRLTV